MSISANCRNLTGRENEILHELSQGLLYKEIAGKVFLSVDTVKVHVKSIYRKLDARNRTEAINKFYTKQVFGN